MGLESSPGLALHGSTATLVECGRGMDDWVTCQSGSPDMDCQTRLAGFCLLAGPNDLLR